MLALGSSGVGRAGLCMLSMKLLGMDGEEKHQWAVGGVEWRWRLA